MPPVPCVSRHSSELWDKRLAAHISLASRVGGWGETREEKGGEESTKGL